HPSTGGAGQLLDMMGTSLPFPKTERERQMTGDRRRSIAERYRDRDDYTAQARAAAQALVTAGYLLDEDLDLAVELAARRYDALAPAAVTAPG
ncbi:MAG TPA: alpha/beta hydrolase domain-containing protein, partial [Chloroflexota bacterium]